MRVTREYSQQVVDELYDVIHQDINFMDETGTIIASTDKDRIGEIHGGAVRILQEKLKSLVIYREDVCDGTRSGINFPIIQNDTYVGVIGITGDPDVVSPYGDVICRMAEILLRSALQKEQMALQEQARSLFLENWLFSESQDYAALAVRGSLLGFQLHLPYSVAILQPDLPDDGCSDQLIGRILQFVKSEIAAFPGSHATILRNQILILLCLRQEKSAYSLPDTILRHVSGFFSTELYGGASISNGDPGAIRKCYEEARLALKVARNREEKKMCFYQSIHLDFALAGIPEEFRLKIRRNIFAACTPEEIREYSQLIRLYFQENGNIQTCADKRYQHRNTIQYHIDTLQKKTQLNLRSPRDGALLYIAATTEAPEF